MGLKDCVIIFDNPYSTYYVGQTVSGRVEMTFDTAKKIRGILIKFKGESNVRWTVEESRTNNEGKTENERVDMSGTEEYFKIQYYCLGGKESDAIELPPGKHVYPFTCILPPTLPSSFEGEYGYVRYTIKVILDRPWKFDQETKTAFTVLSVYDMNLNPSLREPARITLEKFFCCCWCKSGPLTCVVTVPKTGFVSGEVINIIAEVDNISNVEVSDVKFQLQKVVTYYSQFPRRETKKDILVLNKLQVGPVEANGSKTWNQSIMIPPLPPSNLMNCSLIDVDYEITVEVNVSGFHTNLKSKIPITIGTVPIFDGPAPSAPQISTNDSVAFNVSEDTKVEGPQIGWVNNPTVQTFGESTFGTKTITDTDDNQYTRFSNNVPQYNPMYPIYNLKPQ